MFELQSISDDEIDYFRNLKNQNSEKTLLSFISNLENADSQNIVYPVNNSNKITANIATQIRRFDKLLTMLDSIEGQFDEIRIYLNDFDYVPHQLKDYTTYIGNDLTDNAKFFWSNNDNEYYFTLDDDIIYPSDYVEKTLPIIGNRIISYHGRILIGKNRGYYDKHKAYMFYDELKTERKLDVMGTGVSAFDTNFFKPNLWKTPNYKMTDLLISLEAHMNNIPIICPVHSKNWITFEEFCIDSIWYEMQEHDHKLSIWADMISTLLDSNIDLSVINYEYDENSIKKIISYQDKIDLDNFVFINIRTGNGLLSDKISKFSNFKYIYSFDTDKRRVEKCNKSYLHNHVQYKHVNSYSNCNLGKKNCFVLCDDYMLSNQISTIIFNDMKVGSHLICHNLVNGILPDDKILLNTCDGKEITFFYYLKK